VAIRVANSVLGTPEKERLAGWSRRQGVSLDVAGESAPAPAGWDVVRIALTPVTADIARRLARFGVRSEATAFSFDGRTYGGPEDAIAVRDPAAPAETLIVANGRAAAMRIAARRLFFREGAERDADYRVASGELSKTGRFIRAPSGADAGGGGSPVSGVLAIDRTADHDEIGGREAFVRSLHTVERSGVRWRYVESEPGRAAVARLEALLARYRRPRAVAPVTVRIFPDPAMKAHLTGSSRPADVSREEGGVVLDVDASAPVSPDLVSPYAAAAFFAAETPKLLERPRLLVALGARAVGRFWERDVPGFAAFARQAGVEVSVEDVLRGEDDISPIVATGSAAAWIDAGVHAEGEVAVLRALAGPERALVAALDRWRPLSAAARFSVPRRRALPPGFLRGVSYAMSNSIETGYASPRSGETLARLAKLGADSISVIPFSFQPDAARPEIAFVHRNPQGETDEGTVHAVDRARALGMTSMLKPQIWVGHDVFVGRIAMTSDADWAKWFAFYRKFAVHHALVAEASRADLYCIGTELMETESHAKEWRELAAALRLATGASLTYAANWVAGAVHVPFWDALDAIGVDFYDPLSARPEASDAELETGARAAARPLEQLSQRTSRPVIFTEAGYPLARAAWMTPHDENTGRPASAADAARAMAALARALEKETWWKGIYWWKAFSSGRDARPDEKGFNVLGGLPEQAMSEGFARLARARGDGRRPAGGQ